MKKNKGFTLIELLVVIAVIGILAAVVLTSLGGARSKSKDTAIKSGLNQARVQADLFYATGATYTNVCAAASDALTPRGIYNMVLNSGKTTGQTVVRINGVGASTLRCNSTAAGWAAEVPLNSGGYYCVDYTRKGISTAISIGDSNAFCQ